MQSNLRTGHVLAAVLILGVTLGAASAPAAAQHRPRAVAQARPAPAPSVVPTPLVTNAPVLTPATLPSPISSLPPASQPSTLPYPAYGTPAPGVDRGVPVSDAKPVVSLDQAIAIAFARSPLLAQARAAVMIATAPVDLAKSAIIPRVNGTASSDRTQRQAGSSTNGSPTIGNSFTTNSLGLELQQLIYDGGKVAAELRSAKANQIASLANYKRELQTVAFNVANAYYAALAAQRQTEVDVATVQLDQVDEDLVVAELRAGTASQVDLATAQLPTAQARVAVVKAQGAELSAQAAFVNAMGLDANAYVLPQDDGNVLSGGAFVPAVPVPTYDQAIARALMLRPDYYSSVQTVQGYEASLRAAKLGLWPNLNGTATTGTASTDPGGGTFRNASSIGVTLSVPIYDGGVTAANVMQVQGELDNANASLVNAKLGIQLNVKQTLVNLVAARGTFDQTQAELAKAQEVLRATQAQFAAGVTTLPLLLNAQVGITQALTDQVTALYTLRQAEAAFLYAEGANAPA